MWIYLGKEPKSGGKSEKGSSALLLNESLEGHTGEISSVTWNDDFNKLTTADSNGKIIVWVCMEGQWVEEMVNKRDNTTVTSMKWSSNGQHICITYNDGILKHTFEKLLPISNFCCINFYCCYANRRHHNGFIGRHSGLGERNKKHNSDRCRSKTSWNPFGSSILLNI